MTLSYAHGASHAPLLGETIGVNLERTVARVPDCDALVSRHQGLRYTYAQLDEAVDVVARGLLDMRLSPGDRVGMWSPNNAEWVLVQYATAKIGVILVNINPAYRTSELEYALRGPLKAGQVKALQAWVESAPATPTDRHGDIKVQLSTSTDGRTLLVCDASD